MEPSTPVAEIHDGVIMVSPDEEQMGKKSAVITKSNWSSVKSDGDLDKEALVIYRFIKENKEDEDMAATSDTATEINRTLRFKFFHGHQFLVMSQMVPKRLKKHKSQSRHCNSRKVVKTRS